MEEEDNTWSAMAISGWFIEEMPSIKTWTSKSVVLNNSSPVCNTHTWLYIFRGELGKWYTSMPKRITESIFFSLNQVMTSGTHMENLDFVATSAAWLMSNSGIVLPSALGYFCQINQERVGKDTCSVTTKGMVKILDAFTIFWAVVTTAGNAHINSRNLSWISQRKKTVVLAFSSLWILPNAVDIFNWSRSTIIRKEKIINFDLFKLPKKELVTCVST